MVRGANCQFISYRYLYVFQWYDVKLGKYFCFSVKHNFYFHFLFGGVRSELINSIGVSEHMPVLEADFSQWDNVIAPGLIDTPMSTEQPAILSSRQIVYQPEQISCMLSDFRQSIFAACCICQLIE